jgi:hypothetical protein
MFSVNVDVNFVGDATSIEDSLVLVESRRALIRGRAPGLTSHHRRASRLTARPLPPPYRDDIGPWSRGTHIESRY